MHSSNRFVIKAEEAIHEVMQYQPLILDSKQSNNVADFVQVHKDGESRDFRVDQVISEFTGLSKIQDAKFEEVVENKTLEALKEVQEKAYGEAYQLGLDEGKKEAFKSASEAIEGKLRRMEDLLSTITTLKSSLVSINEAHLVELVYHLASRLAFFEIEKNPQTIVHVLRESVKLSEEDQKLSVRISPSEMDFLEQLQTETHRDLEFLKKIELVAEESIKPGGCIISSNYSEVDARVESRVEQLWNAIKDTLPQKKNSVGSVNG